MADTVTQADRDRAADIWRDYVAKPGECIAEIQIRAGGVMDRLPLTQAFARHRIAHQPDSALVEDFLSQLRRVNSERYEAWATRPVMLCEHCGADEGTNLGECKPPFKVQPHSFTREHPYLTTKDDAGIMFDAVELGGEVGELLNVVKKLEREDRGWRGSRAGADDFADECADVLICLDKLARRKGVDLAEATIRKFNATSDKVGLPHKITALGGSNEPS